MPRSAMMEGRNRERDMARMHGIRRLAAEAHGFPALSRPGADAPGKVLAILTKSDEPARRECKRLQARGGLHGLEFFSAECYRAADGAVVVERSAILAGGSLPALVERLAPDGILICGNLHYFDEDGTLSALDVPIVSVASAPERPRPARPGARGFVLTDEGSIASCAAQHLLALGFRDFGYVPFSGGADWSRRRRDLFRRRIAAAGKAFHGFDDVADAPDRADALSRWLAGLPKPCGILAANDVAGEEVLRLCARLGLRVPNDVAVIGVDNRADICEETAPTLSSVATDLAAQCDEAVALLAELMEGGARRRVVRTVPARGVVERSSTRLLRDARVARALEFIRLHACDEGFSVPDVVQSMCVCRTLADRLFRTVAGRSILNEIHSVRIQRAKELLAAGKKPDVVAAECGYASSDDFRRVFRQFAGLTPRKWALAAKGEA